MILSILIFRGTSLQLSRDKALYSDDHLLSILIFRGTSLQHHRGGGYAVHQPALSILIFRGTSLQRGGPGVPARADRAFQSSFSEALHCNAMTHFRCTGCGLSILIFRGTSLQHVKRNKLFIIIKLSILIFRGTSLQPASFLVRGAPYLKFCSGGREDRFLL